MKKKQEISPYNQEDIMFFFDISIYHGKIDMIKWLWEITDNGVNLQLDDYVNKFIINNAFQNVCENNYLITAQWLQKIYHMLVMKLILIQCSTIYVKKVI